MLRAILREFETTGSSLCIDDLALRLDVSAGAVDGMLATLVYKGYLVEVGEQASPCAACALHSGCVLLSNGGRRFRLAPQKRTLHVSTRVSERATD